MRLDYGTLKFDDENEYYTALGSFCNSKAFTIGYEPNKLTGSYSDAYRLRKLTTANELIQPIERAIRSAGRINCNKYVDNLLQNHNFVLVGKRIYGNLENVIKTVPEKYIACFIQGYVKSSDVDDSKLIIYQTENVKDTAKSLLRTKVPKRKKDSSGKNKQTSSSTKSKQDYVRKQIQNIDVGQRGEELVFKMEKEKLLKGIEEGIISGLEGYLKWVSLEDDSIGYDILSFDLNTHKPVYIEVKTTMYGKYTPFYISANEMDFSSQHPDNYRLYRIYDLQKDVANYYELIGDISLCAEVEIDSINYLVSLK